MQTLKYKVISSKSQYKEYCDILESLVFTFPSNKNLKDENFKMTRIYFIHFQIKNE